MVACPEAVAGDPTAPWLDKTGCPVVSYECVFSAVMRKALEIDQHLLGSTAKAATARKRKK